MLYTFDPINGVKTEIEWDVLVSITGKSKDYLTSYKSKRRKIGSLNCYIVDEKFTKKELYDFMVKENIKDEIWKKVEGFDYDYRVSDYGRVKRVFKSGKEKIMVAYNKKARKGLFISFIRNGKKCEYKLSRVVAELFIENKKNLPCVYYKDGNPYNDRAMNLEWVDKKTVGVKTGGLVKGIPVLKLDPVTLEVLDEYTNMAEAGRENFVHRETIRQCIIGNTKTAGGFKWIKDTFKSKSFEEVREILLKDLKCV